MGAELQTAISVSIRANVRLLKLAAATSVRYCLCGAGLTLESSTANRGFWVGPEILLLEVKEMGPVS